MKKYLCLSLAIFLSLIMFQHVIAESEILKQTPPKPLKVLVLVIASDDMPVYLELQKIWRAWMHLDKEHVEAYFLKSNPKLAAECEISGDVIWSRVPHGLAPGIVQKTLLSLELLQDRLKEFDYVVRTNLSSFYVVPRLLAYLETLPKTGCFSAHIDGDPRFFVTTWACGAGIILSRDTAEMLVRDKLVMWNSPYVARANDDLIISAYFRDKKIKLLSAPREDILIKEIWEQRKDAIPASAFHFRVKNPHGDLRLTDDVYVHRQLLEMFYPEAKIDEK